MEMYVLGLSPKPAIVDGLAAEVFRPKTIVVIRKMAMRVGTQFILLMGFDGYSFDLNSISLRECNGWKDR